MVRNTTGHSPAIGTVGFADAPEGAARIIHRLRGEWLAGFDPLPLDHPRMACRVSWSRWSLNFK